MAEAREAMAASSAMHPVHYVTLLPRGPAALAARINLIRAAQHSIDVQNYIWKLDDVGNLMLDELVHAARRGVHVRILVDQLHSLQDVETLARLARSSRNLRVRFYNPTFHDSQTSPWHFAAALACCFMSFNQRMHNKLLLVDDAVGITGGRNYENRYFGWDPEFDYIDRDVMVAGPTTREMGVSFHHFWQHRRAVPLTHLRDVNQRILADGPGAPGWATPQFVWPGRVRRLRARAGNRRWVRQQLLGPTLEVSNVEFFADYPSKTAQPDRRRDTELTAHIMHMLTHAHQQILLQTPYLVLSSRARRIFARISKRAHRPRIIVSTNSLATTDAFVVYAISYKHRKRYLKNYHFNIYELKPYPRHGPGPKPPYTELRSVDRATSAASRTAAASNAQARRERHALGSAGSPAQRLLRHLRQRRQPPPLKTRGVRTGLHAKSIVIDGRFSMVGSHNFDPRSDHFNTECGVIVHSRAFAAQLRRQILRDTRPQNAWVMAPRRSTVPVLSNVNKAIGTVSSHLPLFDFWPYRYATDYDIRSGCKPMRPDNPRFHTCYTSVGDFPEVALPFESIYTRLITAFGVSAQGIL